MTARFRVDDVKVGLFVLIAMLLLVFGSLWIARGSFLGARRVGYQIQMTSSAGVTIGDRVRFAGVSVGRIKRIRLNPGSQWPVVMDVAIRPDIPVREDSVAAIVSSGLLGPSFLQIDGGSPGAALLAAGGSIHGESGMDLDEVMANAQQVSTRLAQVLEQVAQVVQQIATDVEPIVARMDRFVSEDNADQLQQLIETLNATVQASGPRIGPLVERLDAVATDADAALVGLPELTERLVGLTDSLDRAVGPDGERLSRLLSTADGSLDSAGELMALIESNRTEIENTLRDLGETASNLKAFSQTIKERPHRMVRIKAEADRRPGQGVR